MFILSLLALASHVVSGAMTGYDCQMACNTGTDTEKSQCKAGCTCASTTANCDDWCSTSNPLGQSSALSNVLYKYYESTSDSTGTSPGGTAQNNLYELSQDAGWAANCLTGCQARGLCKVNCPASTTAPANGNSGTCGSVVMDGATCTESCNTGFASTLPATRTCTKGSLSNSTIKCQKSNAKCQESATSDSYKIGCGCESSMKTCSEYCDFDDVKFMSGDSTGKWVSYTSGGAAVSKTSYTNAQLASLPNFMADCLAGCMNRGICTSSGYTDQECGMARTCYSCIMKGEGTSTSTSVELGCMWCGNVCKSTGIPAMDFPLNNDAAAVQAYNQACNTSVMINTTTRIRDAYDYCDYSSASGLGPSVVSLGLLSIVLTWLSM